MQFLRFRQIVHKFILENALTWKYVNVNFWAFYPKFHAYSYQDS